ncbi:sulfate reduction electron transfer complex DsrMKJOP subunit DsrO [Desulfatirhabdium butyrativorans]|uniref:sulfate reduction electron transfer complex DsrMKJOP subunit DsrO n=1 Tax=Desulfatirhabdium butyrativorans TaxID=340467 RepID=UPI0004209216|nr:4Fe-4S dicluster domain-containing protein [Desulfatirhabdium butyrativorans]
MSNSENAVSRRQFLGKVGISAAALGVTTLLIQGDRSAEGKQTGVKKYAMVIDTNRCTCCHGCTIACLSENNVPDGYYRCWVKKIAKGRYPNVSFHFLPRLCNHCEDAPCLNLCPTGATYRTQEDGVVHVNREVCVGCHVCIDACPYGARFFNPITHTADKCDFCYHRITQGMEPACVTACTGKARIFGDLNDPTSQIAKYLNDHSTQSLRTDLDTHPKVHYVMADEAILNADYSALTKKEER